MRHISERSIEGLLTASGAITSITILLITIFLFREGAGLFSSPSVESGYGLYVHSSNRINTLSPTEIKEIFDAEITDWSTLGVHEGEIEVFRFEEIFNLYDEEEFGEDYQLLPRKLEGKIAESPDIIAFLPDKYAPRGKSVRRLSSGDISLEQFFAGKEWLPTSTPSPLFGLLPLILGTLLVSIVAIIIALPLGIGVAVYLSELANRRTKQFMKPMIELLAGIPSVVYGFFGLVVLVPIVQKTFSLDVGETALAGSLILAIMALPTIITVAEDAMSNTPRAIREASLALGASQWQTIYKVIIPYSASGISASVILGIGRAIGETMAVLMVTGNAAVITFSLFDSVRTIPATIAAELGEAPSGGAHYQALFMLGCILFVITMIMSIASEIISKKQPNRGI
ncbi:phosphate ABC transporter permease subunit PstC [Porphyromonas sp.]|uniref:phosphate ABC transporter permease subunit PstC n=1 Tax=Porphyromonas sp. TaxID=1924944 RepID=UPI0026DD845E|nr:phosphate ABC transporter permease subunit PstC [Porphyromonas sp.]MDO4695268.1 phosphate ABC transporter permease subunit PstC [Porphyromonas sp.]MDO4770694.1 phosphate ABC transporter permease subunit PstC [Porphyromonas sp.]